MKFGVFSDVHGNLEALRKVWSALHDLDLLDGRPAFNAGDTVGYGGEPEECIAFLKDYKELISVRGNYDRNVSEFPTRSDEYKRKWGRSRPDKYAAIKTDSGIISGASRDWLKELPKEHRLELHGHRVVICHYSPGRKEGLGTWTSRSELEEIARDARADVIICGHTHTPFARSAGGALFVNPGTVGRSRWSRATFAVLDLKPGVPPLADIRSV